MTILYKSDPVRGEKWRHIFASDAPDIAYRMWPEEIDPAAVKYLAAWAPGAEIFAELPQLEVLFSIGAGIDQFDQSVIPPHVSIVRMIEPGIAEGMVEYATFATLALHRHMIDYREAQRARHWQAIPLVAAADRRIGVMGLGQLGMKVIERLQTFGFPISAWSRSSHDVPGVTTFHGEAGLKPFFSGVDVLICLVPLTTETRGILCRATFEQLPQGAGIINVGRGGHLVEHDLLYMLDNGHLSGAVLDVFEPEPLPAEHPFWSHPRIMMTPHIASMTRADSGARAIIANIRRHRDGVPMEGLVNRDRGY